MSSVFNAVWIGYRFTQDFTILQASLPVGAQIRADITYRRKNNTKNTIEVAFQLIAADTWRFELTPEQTDDMAPGRIQFDPVITGAGIEERPVGVRITIPVNASLTDREPT